LFHSVKWTSRFRSYHLRHPFVATMPTLLSRANTLALTPTVTGPVLLAVLYYRRPENLSKLSPSLRVLVTSARFLKALKWCLGLGVAGTVNQWLSDHMLNNWVLDNTWDWPREIVVITGGSGGIGEMMVRRLADTGMKVCVLDLAEPKSQMPPNVFFYQADVTSSTALHSVGEAIRRDHGNPTILINNAGVGYGQTILSEPEDHIQKTFAVNIISHFLTVKEFLPAMIERNHGHIVTIASMSAYVVPAQIVDYAATKAATVAFHEGLGQELKCRYNAPKVRTSVVLPSWIRTPMTTKLLAHPEFRDEVMEPEYIADEVVGQVLSGKSGHLVLPKNLRVMSNMRGFPSWMQRVVLNSVSKPLVGLEEGVI